jgi:phenylpyruvate tautomerase PptA (4-oxalocrotonate tautomerase family)
MPSVLIELRRQYTQEQEIALMEAVHVALREAFKVTPADTTVRLMVHEPHRFACPSDIGNPDFITHISIDAFAGRSLEAKRNLYKTIVNNLEPFGIPKDHVIIVLRELPKENWGSHGGRAACDL